MLSNCCATKLSFRLCKIENLKEGSIKKSFIKLCTFLLSRLVQVAVVSDFFFK